MGEKILNFYCLCFKIGKEGVWFWREKDTQQTRTA